MVQNIQTFKFPNPSYSPEDDVPGPTLNKVYQAALACPIPTRDDILSLLLQPQTTTADLHAITAFLHSAATASLLPSLRALERADNALRHCARCHSTYTDARNTHSACTVPHVFAPGQTPPQTTWIAGDLYAVAGCCRRLERFVSTIGEGPDARARLTQVGSGVCFRGYHTEDPEEVEEDGGYNGVNIKRCEGGAGGCTIQKGLPEIPDEEDAAESLYMDPPPPRAPRPEVMAPPRLYF